MGRNSKERIVFEVLMILGMLALFCLITRLWPLLFLVIPGILIAALRLLSVSAKKKMDDQAPAPAPPEPRRPDTEQDIIRIAFGVLQRRVTEQVTSRYPAARWVWEFPNAMERFTEDLPLTIILNRAGGFRRAMVKTHNLQFGGITYETAETGRPDEPPPEVDMDGDTGCEDAPDAGETVDYALIAFGWVESNLLILNNHCNDAIAENRTTMLIPISDLPHSDSWPQICEELIRNGFAEAAVQSDGIIVSLPE